ncbi:helix-turn-helix transcriptional regulator [Colwellia echini]|uniref:AraC family transcriptional regulator n=1 Tax=Colwellia echini TaxID=1982103 RepID=A0ABY3MUV4_9GAMM|nr:AraC family transcriptional regulator [Colwellia echini]TYK64837.1 AraC family transcriptional regulator [Colwellia echini]
MWQDILNIHQDCEEYFLNFEQMPGNAETLIACAGISTLKTEYQIGKTGIGESFDLNNKRTRIHYMIITHSGGGKITLDNGEHLISAGSIVVLPAGVPFLYELAEEKWDMCWLLLHDCPQFKYFHELTPAVFQSDKALPLYKTMTLLRDLNQVNGQNKTAITLGLIDILVYQIEQSVNLKANLTAQQNKLKLLIQSIKKQLKYPWSVALLAQKMHLSEPQFYRLCKKETGLSPLKLITKYRLEYACNLLRFSNYNLEQIAFTIGYADSVSFAHRFKEAYQISPGKWRTIQKNEMT